MKTIVYLCRHAAYENPNNIFHGRLPGFPLSVDGKQQAKRLANCLKDRSITAVYCSPLTRTRQTAHEIAVLHGLPVVTDDRLLEVKSPLQGMPKSYIDAIDGQFYTPELIARGGESLSDIYGRMHVFIEEKIKQHQGEEIAVVSHGDPIMSIHSMYVEGKLPVHYSFGSVYVPQAGGYVIGFENSVFQKLTSL